MKEFTVKSLKLYSDIDYFYADNIRYHRIFLDSASTYIVFELTIFNKYYDDKDWNLELGFDIYYSFSQSGYFRTIRRTIKKDELVVKVLQEVEIEDIESDKLMNEYTATFRYNDLAIAGEEFKIIHNIYPELKNNPFFEIEKFYLYKKDPDIQYQIFNFPVFPLNIHLELSYNCDMNDGYEDHPDYLSIELLFILRDENGEKLCEYCHDAELYWEDTERTLEINFTREIRKLKLKRKYSLEVWSFGFNMGKYEFKTDNYDEIISALVGV